MMNTSHTVARTALVGTALAGLLLGGTGVAGAKTATTNPGAACGSFGSYVDPGSEAGAAFTSRGACAQHVAKGGELVRMPSWVSMFGLDAGDGVCLSEGYVSGPDDDYPHSFSITDTTAGVVLAAGTLSFAGDGGEALPRVSVPAGTSVTVALDGVDQLSATCNA